MRVPAPPNPPAGAPASPPPLADPFEPVVADIRAASIACFATLTPGEYAARLSVVVPPIGRATRVEVDPGNVSDDRVVACLRRQADSKTYPSSPGGRTLRFEIRVQSPGR